MLLAWGIKIPEPGALPEGWVISEENNCIS